MKRDFLYTLDTWYARNKRKPLIVRGMRQTGKTWCVRDFAKRVFGDNFVEINFEISKRWGELFEKDLDPKRICGEIELIVGKKLLDGEALLFLDEIQLCPKALSALRYFYEMLPQIPVIAAGSLLDFALKEGDFPVGRVQFAELYPMSFTEFLVAVGNEKLAETLSGPFVKFSDAVHAKLLEEIRAYSIVGGLPECVSVWSETHSYLNVRELQQDLITAFEQDFGKYPKQMDSATLRDVWYNANASVGRQISYASLSRERTGVTNKKALDLLCRARLLKISKAVSSAKLPFDLDVTPRIKPYAGDIGIYQAMSGRPADEVLRSDDLLNIYNRALAEQFVAQELLAAFGPSEPHWWKRDGKSAQAEVDFMVACNGEVLPIEVKSGAAGSLKSMHQLLKDFPNIKIGVVLSSGQYKILEEKRLAFIPIYWAGSLNRSLTFSKL